MSNECVWVVYVCYGFMEVGLCKCYYLMLGGVWEDVVLMSLGIFLL